jgi:uncharacterized membrane protein YjjP (DUF1212 family)
MKTLNFTSQAESSVHDQELDRVAEASLCAARLLMEAGAPAKLVHEECFRVAYGLGAKHVALRSGYASLDITITRGACTVTRVEEVGPLGVNYRLAHSIRKLAHQIGGGGITAAEALSEMTRLKQDTARHAPWVVALAVGIACASFGRLLGMDWAAFIPVAASGSIGQFVRHSLLRHGANVFVVAVCVSLLASSVGAIGARWAGSTTLNVAMIASVLLLVPGVPALDAQLDILAGHPTLGNARGVVVTMILICIATGILIARALLRIAE